MNIGKTLFAQIMEFVPWTSFSRIVQRYSGDSGVRRLTCAEQFRVMAFAQLTWRESLRDIEVTLGANAAKLYAMGFRHSVHRSTLADANESRDWRIWADLAAVLIRSARKLYVDEDLGLELKNTVYALDATTIDLCLSLFEWAPFRSTKAAIKLHTLLDLRAQVRNFMAHGAFGKRGEAFHFHSGAGAAPVLLTSEQRHKFSVSGRPPFDERIAIDEIELFLQFLWSGPCSPARCYLSSGLPSILTYAADGTYAQAMQSDAEMEAFVHHLTYQAERAANMDW